MAASNRPRQAPSADATQTQTEAAPQPRIIGTLRLRGEHVPPRRRIQWADDVVDNEGMGKKKSKVCCIYHRPREVGESSSEDDSSSSSDSDSASDSDDGTDAEPHEPAEGDKENGGRAHADDESGCEHDRCRGKRKGKGHGRRKRPNAYEKEPRKRKGKGGSKTVVVQK